MEAAGFTDPGPLQLIFGLLGGLALFLFGMEQMADALKAVAGERMKSILAKLTTNRFMGAATGAFVTAIIQSSSVTTVLVVLLVILFFTGPLAYMPEAVLAAIVFMIGLELINIEGMKKIYAEARSEQGQAGGLQLSVQEASGSPVEVG